MSMKDEETPSGDGSRVDLESFAQPLLKPLWDNHVLVARKLSMATSQLQSAESIEEYQQVGILVRDAWIEFAQKLFSVDFLPSGAEIPGRAHATKMLEYTIAHWPTAPKQVIGLVKILVALANKVQHDTSIDAYSAKWCILGTLFAMTIMLDLDAQYDKLADRKYYRCPSCGSLNLSYEKDQEVFYDGPGNEYEIWSCEDCDWEHFIYLV